MQITDLLDVSDILTHFQGTNKKQALRLTSTHMADKLNLDADDVLHKILEREKLGSTGVGQGVAIPHARIDGLTSITACFALFNQAIDFDSIDEDRVDLMFFMLAPTDVGAVHLQVLSKVSRLFRNEGICKKLRGTNEREKILSILAAEAA